MKSAAFHMKSAAFHEKRRFSKDHLQGIVTLCFGTVPLTSIPDTTFHPVNEASDVIFFLLIFHLLHQLNNFQINDEKEIQVKRPLFRPTAYSSALNR